MPTTSYPRKSYPRKSQTREQQLESAIERATNAKLKASGSGTLVNGSRFWIVPSHRVGGMHHVVKQTGKSLECDCLYSTMRGKVCIHRAVVHLILKGEAASTSKTRHAPSR